MPTTHTRRDTIRELLSNREVRSQTELQELLEGEGILTSQPVLSRDLRALGVAKQGGAYHVVEEERVTPLTALRSLLRSSSPASHFEIVRCEPGAASAVARALEGEGIEGVLGTIAGDDTVLVVLAHASAGAQVRDRISNLV